MLVYEIRLGRSPGKEMSRTILNVQISLDPGSNQQAQGQAEGGDAAAQDLRHQADGAQIMIVDRDHLSGQRSPLRSSATRPGVCLELEELKVGVLENEVCGMVKLGLGFRRHGRCPVPWFGLARLLNITYWDVYLDEDLAYAGALGMAKDLDLSMRRVDRIAKQGWYAVTLTAK
ncbi:hypothetical protein BP00DRAFT_419665 [Aspergillus indologenus CBS 114.80]|uniref:Uncharacterized protein n=1 Tax=Aspergillus indologenus CBS 114.80 TaxID=1450541 RepID=A0A2V5HRN0_9EURO|nr:hypothetical protein BP00DRAFT_419665 [Aspergillus indologenus CBS 114.80]